MFVKRLERRKGRKKHTYWALVESYRTGKGSRHRVVAYLGELSKRERSGWEQLGRRLNGKGRPQRTLFDPPDYDEPTDKEPVLVKLKSIQLQRLRDFGDIWLALGLWRLLGLDTLLENLIPTGREDVPWPVVASILTIARLCEPSSELHSSEFTPPGSWVLPPSLHWSTWRLLAVGLIIPQSQRPQRLVGSTWPSRRRQASRRRQDARHENPVPELRMPWIE